MGANLEVLFVANVANSEFFTFCMLYTSPEARMIFLKLSR